MKIVFLFSAICFLAAGCSNNKIANGDCYKGRLEIKAICMNYTIKLLEGNLDTSSVAATWTDESTGKTYSNVFALGNPCSFPANIQEGQEFYFTIDNTKENGCAVCQAYYPTPPKKLNIRVLSSPCK